MFPARPRVTTRWTENPRLLPFGLRGDTADLPGLAGLDAEALAGFADACAERDLAEERRLAYVGATRAAFWLGCSGFWWGNGTSRLGPSVFLAEIRAACDAGAGTVAHWAPEPDAGRGESRAGRACRRLVAGRSARRPVRRGPRGGGAGGGGDRRRQPPAAVPTAAAPAATGQSPRLTSARGWLRGAVAAVSLPPLRPLRGRCRCRPAPTGPAGLSDADQAMIAAWAADASLLLAEREQRRGEQAMAVSLPRRLPVSSLVTMARDPGRAGPAGPAADAAPASATRAPRHRVSPLAGGAVRAAAAHRPRRAARRRRRRAGRGRGSGTGRAARSGSRAASGLAGGQPRSRCRSRR